MFKKNRYLSKFGFNQSEQQGIIVLLFLILAFSTFNKFYSFQKASSFDSSSEEIVTLQQQIDSLEKVALEKRKPKLYPFNPNFITDYKSYVLGMKPEEFDRLKAFREKNQWINSVTDFQQVTQVSDQWLDSISPYFKFPDWVTRPKPKRNTSNFDKEKTFSEKQDLNLATEEELQTVYGVGTVLSSRILEYRTKLGGFTDEVQLYAVYGLSPSTINNILKQFAVKTPKELSKMNINTASASDIATLPGISFPLAKEIWEFVMLREGISSFEELRQIENLSAKKLQLIQLYLFAE